MRMELSLSILEVGSMLTSALQICIETEREKKSTVQHIDTHLWSTY